MTRHPTLVIVWISSIIAFGEGFSGKRPSSTKSKTCTTDSPSSRRDVMERIFGTLAVVEMAPAIAQAACLMGDTSEDCIGMYKMPLDDEALPYVDTAETLAKFAPGIRWVPPVEYPKSYNDAKKEMISLRDSVSSLNEIVLKGNLVEAGSLLLGIVPRLTVSGRVMIQTLEETKGKKDDLSMRALRLQAAHTDLLGKLGECDIIIGQALSGQLGSTTFAQIQILSELKDADALFDELIRAIPESYNQGKKK
jgi:hypothetical protein